MKDSPNGSNGRLATAGAPQVFSTAGLPAARRIELWEGHNASALIGLSCHSAIPLEATEVNVPLGRVQLARVTGSPHVVERGAAFIRRDPADEGAVIDLVAVLTAGRGAGHRADRGAGRTAALRAAAIGVSERHLSRVLAAGGTTVPRLVRSRRLERAYAMLAGPGPALAWHRRSPRWRRDAGSPRRPISRTRSASGSACARARSGAPPYADCRASHFRHIRPRELREPPDAGHNRAMPDFDDGLAETELPTGRPRPADGRADGHRRLDEHHLQGRHLGLRGAPPLGAVLGDPAGVQHRRDRHRPGPEHAGALPRKRR